MILSYIRLVDQSLLILLKNTNMIFNGSVL